MDLDFADDAVLLADSWLVMVTMVMKLEELTQRFGTNTSARKSEFPYIGRDEGSVLVHGNAFRGQAMK